MERVSPFQLSVLETPEQLNLALLGARGGGKSTAAVMLAVRHLEQYGEEAAVLIVRKTYRALADFEDEMLGFVSHVTQGSHSYNRAEKILRWNGGTIRLTSVERTSDYTDRLQGVNVTLLVVDEVTAYSSERILRLLRSNLRAPEGMPTRVVYLGNPGGPLHGRIYERHVKDRVSHVPYELPLEGTDDTEPWVSIFSGPADNPFIDVQAYIRRLREACHGDTVRLQQWLFGDWTQGEGLLFPSFKTDTHILPELNPIAGDKFRAHVAIDWGISSPSVALLGAKAKRDLETTFGRLPAGSVVVWDEATDAIFGGDNLNSSSEWPPDRLAERTANMCADQGVRRPNVVVDSARGLQGDTVLGLMRETGSFWNVTLPKKGRRAEGWAHVNSMLLAAAERDPKRPHLYISERCKLLLATLPNAVRDERDPDDWHDTPHCPDHAGDALRYLLAETRTQSATTGRVTGLF